MLSIIIPVYNGIDFLEMAVSKCQRLKPAEILIAEDGSSDGSYEKALELERKFKNVRLLHEDKKSGKGTAIKRGVFSAKCNTILLMDVDVPSSIYDMKKLIKLLDVSDISIILRLRKNFPFARRFLSWGYGSLSLLMFGINLDYQSSTIAFKKEKGKEILKNQKISGLAWSTEFLIKAIKKRYDISEVTSEYAYSKSPIGFRNAPGMLRDLVKIWWEN